MPSSGKESVVGLAPFVGGGKEKEIKDGREGGPFLSNGGGGGGKMITQDASKEKKKKGDEKDNIPGLKEKHEEDRERSEETSRHDSKTAGFHNVSVSKLMFSFI